MFVIKVKVSVMIRVRVSARVRVAFVLWFDLSVGVELVLGLRLVFRDSIQVRVVLELSVVGFFRISVYYYC